MNPPFVALAQVNRAGTSSLVLAFKPKTTESEVVLVGHFSEPGAKPNWKSLVTTLDFIKLFTRYMKGGLSLRPGILEEAKVTAGQHVYVIDRRAANPEGDVPFHDIIGWYTSDGEGRPRPESFEYNPDHRLALEDGTLSSVLSDPMVYEAVLAAGGRPSGAS